MKPGLGEYMELKLKPVSADEKIMRELEERGLIMRLTPGGHAFEVRNGEAEGRDIYVSEEKYGAHKLISAVIDSPSFSAFGAHADNEEFILLGGVNERPLYLLISYLTADGLKRKTADNTVAASDFICLDCKFNDPYLSFFTMLKNVPHGEASAPGNGKPPSFYVTEPSKLGIDLIKLPRIIIELPKR